MSLVLAFGSLTGCGGGAETDASANEPGSYTGTAGAEEDLCPGGGFVSGGVDTEGRECAAMAGTCCYESPDDACDAMDCEGECDILESHPAQISCR